jgi:hypothetical protein
MTRFLGGFSASLLSVLLLAGIAEAQLSTAQLSGRVVDESRGVLPGATVTVVQTATGFTRSDVTDANGAYVMPNLPLGPYRLEVSLSGFSTHVQTGIVLQVGAAPVINATLVVGGLEESVTVEGAAPLVDVQSSGISEVVQNEEIPTATLWEGIRTRFSRTRIPNTSPTAHMARSTPITTRPVSSSGT